jgi:tight adherence protein C
MKSDVLCAIAAVALGAAVFTTTFAAARAPSRKTTRLGLRGKRRMETLAKSPTWAKIEPLVRWLGVRLDGLLPDSLHARIDRQLVEAGEWLGLVPSELVALSVLGGVTGAIAVLLLPSSGSKPFFAIGFVLAGFMGPWSRVTGAAQERKFRVNRSLPYAVDLMVLTMGAGVDFPGALRKIAAQGMPDDPLVEELEYVLQMLQLGHTRRAALESFAHRVPTEPVKELVGTVINAEERGNPLADVLVIQADVSRQRRTTRGEEEAAKAGAKLVLPVALIVVALMLLLGGPIMLDVSSTLAG